jgi:hypothetical protein
VCFSGLDQESAAAPLGKGWNIAVGVLPLTVLRTPLQAIKSIRGNNKVRGTLHGQLSAAGSVLFPLPAHCSLLLATAPAAPLAGRAVACWLQVEDQDPEGKYEALAKYARDLTQAAREGKLDPVIGRDEEVGGLRLRHAT